MSEQPQRKKRRQNVACDSCRLRRVKCDMLALLTPKDGGPERPLHVLVLEHPDVSCTNCVSKGIRCTTNQIVNPAKPNKGGKRIEEAKKMFGSDGFQHSTAQPVTPSQTQPRRVTMPRSPSVPTPSSSSSSSLTPNPPTVMPVFGPPFNMSPNYAGHPNSTATFAPPAPIPPPIVHPSHGWTAPPFDDWAGLAFEAQSGMGFAQPVPAFSSGSEVASWEPGLSPAPPAHAHNHLPVLPSAMSRFVPPPPPEPMFLPLADKSITPQHMPSSTSSTTPFLLPPSLSASPGVKSDVCLSSHPPSRSDSDQSNHQSRVAGKKRTLSEQEDDDVLELVRSDDSNHLDPAYMWHPRDKVMLYSPAGNGQNVGPGMPLRREGNHNPSVSNSSVP